MRAPWVLWALAVLAEALLGVCARRVLEAPSRGQRLHPVEVVTCSGNVSGAHVERTPRGSQRCPPTEPRPHGPPPGRRDSKPVGARERVFSWRELSRGGDASRRQKRDWVIPPISVPENDRGPFPKHLVTVKSDKDGSSELRYSVTGPGSDLPPIGVFTINAITGRLYVTRSLDREHIASYQLRGHAVDLNGNQVENAVELLIQVIDQNDNKPDFSQAVYNGSVPEGSPPGTPVMRVRADDADDAEQPNGMVRYKVVSQEPERPFPHMFTINNATGLISTIASGLDREKEPVYRLRIQATDMEGTWFGLTSTALAVIHVMDVNDNPPEFRTSTFYGYVRENVRDVTVANMSVLDLDGPGTAAWRARYAVLRGDPGGHFAVHTDPLTNNAILTVVKPVDYEVDRRFVLLVEAKNEEELQGSPYAPFSTATVSVAVSDDNEAPRFWPERRTVRVAENVTPGTAIGNLSARDPDSDMRQTVRFSKLSDPAGWLSVDALGGRVVTTAPLDRESPFVSSGSYVASFIATDGAGGTGTGSLLLELVDMNDNAPALLLREAELCLRPRARRSLNLTATDADGDPNGQPFSYELAPSPPDVRRNWTIRRIDGRSVELQLRVPQLPVGRYAVPVRVTDSGNPAMSNVSVLLVKVCVCTDDGECALVQPLVAALGTGAIIAILTCVLLLLVLVLLLAAYSRRRDKDHAAKELLFESEEDVRDNILRYDEEGGGEEDQDYDLSQLQRPGDSPLRRPECAGRGGGGGDAGTALRRLDERPTASPGPRYPSRAAGPPQHPSDMMDFIGESLRAADQDPTAPPYDSLLMFDYEGSGSTAGSLSSLESSCCCGGTEGPSGGDPDHDYAYLREWGPRFRRLADMYGSHE
ncbi:cadherin-2-like [Lampetra fluviatilis]